MGYITKGNCEWTTANKIKFLVGLVLGVSCLALAAWTVVVDPIILIARYQTRVDYGSIVHEALSKEADSVHIYTYLFNISNAERFATGEDDKLKVQEVGPFVYQENRTNDDLEIDKEAGVMRYSPHHRVSFLPEESVGRPEDTIVTVANIAMLGFGSEVVNYGYLAKAGFNMLTTKFGSNATVTMSAHDILWGYKEPLIKLGNTFMPGLINFDTFGLLDRLYDERAPLRVEVSIREEDKFMIKSSNGIGGLPMRGFPETSSRCNSFEDVFEGLLYPPGMSQDRPIRIYRNVLCRFMDLDYVGRTTTKYGVEGMAYKITNRSYCKIPENECLCNKGKCYDGMSDLSACMYGIPLVLSNAHFLDTSPSLYERIEGMKPNKEQHDSKFIIDPILGMVMSTKFSVQVNVAVQDVGFNSKISPYSNMTVPIIYFKIEQPKLQLEQISTLRMLHIYRPYCILTLQIVLTVAGFLLLVYPARILYCHSTSAKRKGIDFKTEIINVNDTLSSKPLMNR